MKNFSPELMPARTEALDTESNEAEKNESQDLKDFADFVMKRKEEIGSLKDASEIERYIYDNFYNQAKEKIYNSENGGIKQLADLYNDNFSEMQERLWGEGIRVEEMGYWAVCFFGNDLLGAKNIGRIYLNTKPEETSKLFGEAAKSFSDMKLNMRMKMPSDDVGQNKQEYTLNRQDKIIVYFGGNDDKKVLDVITHLYDKYPGAFDINTPRFTAKLKGSSGQHMNGVGFAEEPDFKRKRSDSFGEIRSAILCEVAKSIRLNEDTIDGVDFEQEFEKACNQFKVNPAFPAFNSTSKRMRENSPIIQRL